MSKKEDLEEMTFDLELDKQLEKNNDWKRLEKWKLGRKDFLN